MSLPWKKTKQSRISRFMSEFQHSPKRGSSLFVETGFPASLVDLFFKNRDRLRKSSKYQTLKRQNLKRQIETAPNAVNPNVILEKPAVQKVNNKNANEKSDCVCGGGIAFVLMAFKVLIVMLLALSTKKKLTVGITLSAFALLLTELAAARLLTRSKVCNKTERNGGNFETCKEQTEVAVMEKQSLKQEMFTVRDLLLKKDEKSTSKSSRLKSKIVKKLRSYKKKKEIIITKKMEEVEESLSVVSEDKPEITEEEEEEESKGDQTNGIVVMMMMMVTVLVGLLSGKIVAIGLTVSCLCLKFGLAKRSGLCN